MQHNKIQDYGIIGDGQSAALISLSGSIDWLCWPRFDSPSLFGRILDTNIGGTWKIAPTSPSNSTRCYIEKTNILQTKFHTPTGQATLTDFMLALTEEEKQKALFPEHELIRLLHCVSGEMEIDIVFQPAPNYALKKYPLRDFSVFGLRLEIGNQLITLQTNIKFDSITPDAAKAKIKMKENETVYFSLSFSSECPAVIPPINQELIFQKLNLSTHWWQDWSKILKYEGPYHNQVLRSALALKLLGFAPSGAFIAAPTTSLPEKIGADYNWDYRYCWLRDASFTVQTLLDLGYIDEVEAFVNWMLHSTRLTLPKLKTVYDVYGNGMADEKILSHLKGYVNSKPVRIGNAAYDQQQLDVYGEVIDGVYYFTMQGGKLDRSMKKMLRRIGNYICKNWEQKDNGIWETRDGVQKFTFSRVMSWVVLDRLVKMKDICSLSKKEEEKFTIHSQKIRTEIEEKGWNQELEAYTSILQGDQVDASLLLMAYYKFDSASSIRMQSTFNQIKKKLGVNPGLIYRYEKSINNEGAFLICSSWLVDFCSLAGKKDEAEEILNHMLKYGNDLGLFAEEADPQTGDALGNFPQAFTHLGIINAALSLQKGSNKL